MKERKQSFLERLSGTMAATDADPSEASRVDERILGEKPWSPRVNNTDEAAATFGTTGDLPTEEDAAAQTEDDGDDEPGLAVDIFESDNELIIQSMIAGVTPENLHITVTRDAVTIKGKRIPPQGVPEEQYVGRELYWGEFSREISLPFEVDTDGAEAVEKYGLLIIRLPRLDNTRVQELKVRSI
jgi:HSP20 family protein